MSRRVKFAIRAFNAVISLMLLVLLLAHAVSGGFVLLGINGSANKLLSWSVMVLALIHASIGLYFTVLTLLNGRNGAFKYAGANAAFWSVRISGVALLLLLCFHVGAFGAIRSGQFILYEFTKMKLFTHILLVAALGVHLIAALRPMLVATGLGKGIKISPALMAFLSVMILFFTVSIIFYFLMWNF